MRMRSIRIISIILISALLLTGCTAAKEDTQTGVSTQDSQSVQKGNTDAVGTTTSITSKIVVDTEFTARDLEVGYEETTATHIILNGDSIAVSGEGATTAGNNLTITKEGSYVVEGILKDGQIIIDAGDNDKIQLILNGASITCLSNAPIYIKNADKVFITLAKATNNSLIDGSEYIQLDENQVDGVIYSKSDLTLNGSGSLTITGNYKHGIVSKDDLVITGGTYAINAVKDAINGKDCVKIKDGKFTLNAATGNGIQSKNGDDTTKGYVYINGGTIDIVNSVEGIEGTAIVIEDGIININSSDDGFNAASKSTVASTEVSAYNATTSEVPSDNTAIAQRPGGMNPGAVQGGQMTEGQIPEGQIPEGQIPEGQMPEGQIPEGQIPEGQMPDGQIPEGQIPDGQKPNRGFPGGGMGGKWNFGGGDDPFAVDENCYIKIAGGTITVNAQGDGIDSNGSLYISGGTIYINGPTENMDSSIDYPGTGEITGGIIVATGSAGMAQGFGETSTQCSMLYNLPSSVEAETAVILTNSAGKEVIRFVPGKQYQSVVISSPELIQGETYTLTCGNQTAEITLSSITTSGGQSIGMGPRGMGR